MFFPLPYRLQGSGGGHYIFRSQKPRLLSIIFTIGLVLRKIKRCHSTKRRYNIRVNRKTFLSGFFAAFLVPQAKPANLFLQRRSLKEQLEEADANIRAIQTSVRGMMVKKDTSAVAVVGCGSNARVSLPAGFEIDLIAADVELFSDSSNKLQYRLYITDKSKHFMGSGHDPYPPSARRPEGGLPSLLYDLQKAPWERLYALIVNAEDVELLDH